MKTCAVCNVRFNDGVQCGSCKKHLDFECANISEAGWRKLGATRMAQWKCLACKTSSPAVPTSDQASLETILSEIRDMKRQLINLPTLIDDIKVIKEELSDLKSTCEGTSGKLEEFDLRIAEVENKVSEIDKMQETINDLQTELSRAKFEIASFDQRSRLNNIEIKGVPIKKGENLFSIIDAIGRKVNYSCPKTLINYVSRVPIFNSNEKLIVVGFLNRYVKEDFIAAARAVKDLCTTDIGFQGTSRRVFVNDHLSVEYKKLLSKTKTIAKEKNYEFIWVKHGKIHVLKNTNSKVLIVRKESDLNKIA
ncbi:uncharacterized protein LOC135117900 [Helicoverpa armigera]|uniref:uncharacterized protein LOC135117900 n=1 Tax=Helicoverpa armigera TaxID=29058 RepID=UPI0021130C6A|nr:uncharacterized protein LOC126054817 [Helicoverpa armigera]